MYRPIQRSFASAQAARLPSRARSVQLMTHSDDMMPFMFSAKTSPLRSINYAFTGTCNLKCGFEFASEKTAFNLPLDEAKYGLSMLREAGMDKITFSGSQPFLMDRGAYLGELVRFAKKGLGLDTVQVTSNANLVTYDWLSEYATMLDALAININSFQNETGKKFGKPLDLDKIHEVQRRTDEYGIDFKVNTVVSSQNWKEDMTDQISSLSPVQWKVIQCLLLDEQNVDNGDRLEVSDKQFASFITKHEGIDVLVAENRDTNVVVDEWMRFLDSRDNGKIPTESIMNVGVWEAFSKSGSGAI